MCSSNLHRGPRLSAAAAPRRTMLAMALAAFLAAPPVLAQSLAESIDYQVQPPVQSGVPITSGAASSQQSVAAVENDPNLTVTTRQLGKTTVREFSSRGRVLYIEVTPEGGVPYYIDQSADLLSGHANSAGPESFRPNSWLITTW